MYPVNLKLSIKFLFYFFLYFLLIIIIYGVYLYFKINQVIHGKIWKFPISIYSRIVTLEPGNNYSKKDIIAILKSNRYKQVNFLTMPGEFLVKRNSLILIRRSFNFPEGFEDKISIKLLFDKNKLVRIVHLSNNRNFSILRLDPQLIAMIYSPKGEKRLFVSQKNYPKALIQTLLTIEDKCFYNHYGINFYSMFRAFFVNLISGHSIQGGSTLTQQLVKNLFLTNIRSLWRKINEIYMALILDFQYSKEKILELYLNEVYLGQDKNEQIRGFALASLYYFGRPINELRLDECALLVGMVKGASLYNPWNNPVLTLNRRNLVLYVLFKHKVINRTLYEKLKSKPLNIQSRGNIIWFRSAFVQIVEKEFQKKVGYYFQNFSGIKIFTTLDLISQIAAENAIRHGIQQLKKKYKLQDLEASMVIIDRFSGEIRGVLGSSNPNLLGYNRAIQAKRSIGSLSKPITYLAALSQPEYFRLNTWIPDTPIKIKMQNGKLWKPQNNNFEFVGKVMLIDALKNSMNVPIVHLSMKLGLKKIVQTWIQLGLSSNHIFKYPSIALGSINLTSMEVAKIFQVISSGGNKANIISIRSVLSENNKLIYHSFPQSKQVISAQASYLTLYAMQSVVSSGTAKHLGKFFKNMHLAGKTGTTNNLVDSWFVGIDGRQVVIVWIGRDNNKTTKCYGSTGAMKIYHNYLKLNNPKPLLLIPPRDVYFLNINKSGDFMCFRSYSKYFRAIPVWIRNHNIFCT
ncbi:penicillin-binding protein 1B [Buchnera aphidicola str. Bp (Baizongia pistaciae)]|uniref:Penicillin-binding protein 1B n=1 Tax=Buchnera aphidicola subsp. Baizongia pistaciae (strain Bp) TaxID=224915 RepID=PBPB_BUCBP|nr:penicillin-binding protein 1B [Buchnera aphidicola]Q89AR2.1 RecName: Full=Penicillin-binding protein 1B; Short=PBP-1b; Short=PBP1b; AltName: Full=Murein polymerase; Includes: RecName: Full=Penicillin-insensitive transglycosylase; AltName: Full=Peptidoglycan TGase; AltName: Full=Peptidoglycan glycosyltransferase; Includes: RecName: Full=Penicillin-sensitive transpeptidase; AltName: Full=DD-transpeptidase [Buchnera aphidicola str. Bp (Baizongia pistaciae)]AAO26918.1 penicillin-binding protein 1B